MISSTNLCSSSYYLSTKYDLYNFSRFLKSKKQLSCWEKRNGPPAQIDETHGQNCLNDICH